MNGNAGFGELRRVLEHRVAAVRCDDSEVDVGGLVYFVLMGMLHRAGMEGGDLVVVGVRGHECLGGEGARNFDNVSEVDAVFFEPRAVGRKIFAHGSHRNRVASQ